MKKLKFDWLEIICVTAISLGILLTIKYALPKLFQSMNDGMLGITAVLVAVILAEIIFKSVKKAIDSKRSK